MGCDRYQDRVTRLERALLDHGGARIDLDPAGEPDVAGLEGEMRRLGFDLVACDPKGYAYEAEFRGPARDGHHAVHGVAASHSQRNAILEAAIAALGGSAPNDAASPNLRGASPQPIGGMWGRAFRARRSAFGVRG